VVALRVPRLTTLETVETLVRPLGMRSPIRIVASCCCVILLAAPTWAGASSGRTTGPTSGPSLVWSMEDAFGSGTQKYTLVIGNVNGSPARILHEGRAPQISPDGRWVAYSHDEHAYVLSSTGGRPWLAARNAQPARWSETSRYLATVDQGKTLHVTDVMTRRRTTIDRGATILGVSFSPSGTEIVWGRKRGQGTVADGGVDLFRARVDGSRRIRLTRGGRSSFPVWGRQRIAFGRVRPTANPVYPVYELWTMRPTGKGLQRVTRTSHAPVGWSANGQRLLTSSYSKSGGVLSVINVPTGSIRPLVRGQLVLPLSLARDGRSILAWTLSPTRKPQGDLVRVDLDGR
jgi:Tol biopolymer transport system component